MGAKRFERPETEIRIEPIQVFKFWWTASKGVSEQHKWKNEAIEIGYKALLERLKKYYATIENPTERMAVEIDRYEDRTSMMAMYTFITPHAYFQLECKGTKEYQVSYYVDGGKHHDAILQLRKGLLHLDTMEERKFNKPFADYYHIASKLRNQYVVQL